MADMAAERVMTKEEAWTLKGTPVPVKNPVSVPNDATLISDADTHDPVMYAWPVLRELVPPVVRAFREIDRATVLRAGGMRTSSNTFGYSGPQKVFQRFTPTLSKWARDDPEGHQALDTFAAYAWAHLQLELPEQVVKQMDAAREQVDPDWQLGGTGWTSGIANDAAPLYYHRDRNNFADSWSVMLCARAGMGGGDLHIADYDLTVPIRDGWAYSFPGVNLMHGVTPITRRLRGGFRYTFVWYPVKAFGGIGNAEEARAAAAHRTTELADSLIERQRETGLLAGPEELPDETEA